MKIDFAKHAESMGAASRSVESIADLEDAFRWAKGNDRTTVIVIKTEPFTWTPNDAFWDVGVPEVSEREAVRAARNDHTQARKTQRVGV